MKNQIFKITYHETDIHDFKLFKLNRLVFSKYHFLLIDNKYQRAQRIFYTILSQKSSKFHPLTPELKIKLIITEFQCSVLQLKIFCETQNIQNHWDTLSQSF